MEGDRSHVVFSIKQQNESKDKKCTYSTFNKPKLFDTIQPKCAPTVQNFDMFIVNDYTQNIQSLKGPGYNT